AVSRAAFEAVEHGFRAGGRDREDRSPIVGTTDSGGAVEGAVDVEEARFWVSSVSRAAFKAVEHGFRAGGRDRKDRSVAVRAASGGGAVERAIDVEEARFRESAVSGAAEAVEDGFRAGQRDREDRSTAETSTAVAAPLFGRSVQCALDVEKARCRFQAVSRVDREAVEHGFRTGRGDREDRSYAAGRAATDIG